MTHSQFSENLWEHDDIRYLKDDMKRYWVVWNNKLGIILVEKIEYLEI